MNDTETLTPDEWEAITEASFRGGAKAWRAEVERIVAARVAAARADALRQAADQADSVGHHWSGAPALAFFALAAELRAAVAVPEPEEGP